MSWTGIETRTASRGLVDDDNDDGRAPRSISINGGAQQPLGGGGATPTTDSRASGKYKHTFAVHSRGRASCLSHDSEATAPSFLGFRNLMALVLVVSNLRLMIENFNKYGILVTLSGATIRRQDIRWAVLLYFATPCFLWGAFFIELAASEYAKGVVARAKRASEGEHDAQIVKGRKALFSRWWAIAFAHGVSASLLLAFTSWAVYYRIHNPGIGVFTELHAIIVWLKVCSYALTNRDLRHAYLNPASSGGGGGAAGLPALYKTCPYPQNITYPNVMYFWWAPTLVYQPVYPRNERRRWPFIFKRVGECFLLSVVVWVACAQYAVPLLQNSVEDISRLKVVNVVERTLKLSTISLVCWLAGFFALFQSALNLLAELMRFADREFYGDWWNSHSVRAYWTSWNKPVTHFMKRHVYAPLVARGLPAPLAQLLTFLFSGVLHELLVGVPTHNIIWVAFWGMLLQLPLILMTDWLARMRGRNWRIAGNLLFWISFCFLGQPVAALAYFFAWQAKYGVGPHRPEWPIPDWSALWHNRTA